MPIWDESRVAEHFAINLRRAREARGLSQAELAEKVKELGHSYTQATIWKLEQGHREPKIGELAAIGQALGLMRWTDLTNKPQAFELELTVEQTRRRVYHLAEQTRAAARSLLTALTDLAFVVRQAQDAGMSERWAEFSARGWLELSPEATVLREALAARVAWESEDEEAERRMAKEEQMQQQLLRALENSGLPLVINPAEIEFDGPDADGPEVAGSPPAEPAEDGGATTPRAASPSDQELDER